MKIVENFDTKEKKRYASIEAGMLLKHKHGVVLLVTDECDDYYNKILVDVENGVTESCDEDGLIEDIYNDIYLVINDSELSILSYE